jgi:hypothetical protein
VPQRPSNGPQGCGADHGKATNDCRAVTDAWIRIGCFFCIFARLGMKKKEILDNMLKLTVIAVRI